jgi:hypothetical protein
LFFKGFEEEVHRYLLEKKTAMDEIAKATEKNPVMTSNVIAVGNGYNTSRIKSPMATKIREKYEVKRQIGPSLRR